MPEADLDIVLNYVTDFIADSPTQLLRAFRLARLTRMFKVFRLKMIKELQLMIKGLVGGLRTLVLAFFLLFVVLYIIAVFATTTIGRDANLDSDLKRLFRSVPSTMFTAFRCYSGECITEDGLPVALLLSNQSLVVIRWLECSESLSEQTLVWAGIQRCFALLLLLPLRHGLLFVFLYVAGYMLVTMGLPAGTGDWRTSSDWEVGRFLASRPVAAVCYLVQEVYDTPSIVRASSGMGAKSGDDDALQSDQIEISKELKTDTVATLLATKAVYATLEQVCDQILELRRDVAKATGDENIGASKPLKSIFDLN
eukprot:Skav216497  [mRNA]  locus=scaffold1123:553223:559152:- [translate_table: standard]